ncbi:MAG: Rrf2 family transcriptional regulator [Planctomycetes bacterium]|nr:Rrf2 family transcriptional regulator [Planctomycetota bacterium]
MALQEPGSFHLAQDMARELAIPPAFLGKVLQPLVTRGILGSQRGRGGGFRLVRPSKEVFLSEIISTQENLERSRQCVLGQGLCSDEHSCPLHKEWRSRTDSFLDHLDRTSLADLLTYQRSHSDCEYPFPNPARMPESNGAVPSSSLSAATPPLR